VYPKQIELVPFVARAFENIALAKVAASGPEAVKLGFLRSTDKMTVNRDYLIEDAKKTVLAIHMEGYTPPQPLQESACGENTYALIKMAIWTLNQQGTPWSTIWSWPRRWPMSSAGKGARGHQGERAVSPGSGKGGIVSLCGYPRPSQDPHLTPASP